MLSQFHRWGNWGFEGLNNLPEDTHKQSVRPGEKCRFDSKACAFFHDPRLYNLTSKYTASVATLEKDPQITITHNTEKW